jgi:cytoskeletal protein CcmA (bactofilin family)
MLQRDTFFNRNPQKTPDILIKTDGVAAASAAARPSPAPTAAPANETAKPAKTPATGSQMIVGPNIKLKGVEITDCDTLVVEGHVEATMDSRMVQIAQGGTFSGTAGIDIAEIHGKFSGDLTVRKCLTIHATGHVTGKIRYGKVVIEEGGELSGDIKKLSDEENPPRISPLALGGRFAAATPTPAPAHN